MEKPKPRALLIRNAASYDFGGAERFVITLADVLQKNGWEAAVVTKHARITSEAATAGVTTIRCPWLTHQDFSGWRIALTPLYALWQLYLTLWYVRLIARFKPDVVHAQSKDDFIAATRAGKLLKKRVVWTDHADLKYVFQNVPVWYKNPVGKMVRRASRRADAVTVVSKNEGRLVAEALGLAELPANYHVVYNGIVDTDIEPMPREDADRQAVIFCATSRLVTPKGIGELIAAFKQIAGEGDMRLWLVGDGPEEAAFKTAAGNDPHIVFKGFSPDALRWLAAADVFVHPSYHEGFSLSIIEAGMLAKPIIACETGGNPEAVQDNETGLLIPIKDADALAGAMRRLATDKPLRERLASNARSSYEQHFRFDTIVTEQFIPLYEK
jgi:glycosyltransferase involved in cell wall biosynthesis